MIALHIVMKSKFHKSLKLIEFKPVVLSILLTAVFVIGPNAVSAPRCQQLFDATRTSAVFYSRPALKIALKADFSRIAEKSGFQQGTENYDLKKYFISANLEINGKNILVEARGNGSSSADNEEAPFRKLKVRLNSESAANTEFQGVKDFYVNTHMHNNPQSKHSFLGRLIDGNSPFREALVYDLAQILDIETGGYRRAWITYEDTVSKQQFTKQALLIENHDSTAKRLGLKQLSVGEFLNQPQPSRNGTLESLKVHLFQALIGNEDFGYDINRKASPTMKWQPLKNMSAFSGPNGELKPLVYDFDIATMVAGYDQLRAWHAKPDIGLPDIPYAFTYKHLFNLRTQFDRRDLEQGLSYFSKKFGQMKKMIQLAEVDDEGKKVAFQHIENFTKAAKEIFDPSWNFITDANVGFYDLPTGRKDKLQPVWITEKRAFLRIGTPFKILEDKGGYIKIAIFDLKWDLKSETGSIGYIKKDSAFGVEVPQGNLPIADDRDLF